ncbi:MAG: hypothetical protein SV375_12930, partial [Thermodesulfobacteriota bacterium]|nr:hypothetical protein [Thermodesulfobacteriota bacterium]
STLTVRTDSETLNDGEQRSVPVLSRGLPKVYDFSGRTKNHGASIDIQLPAGHVLELTSLEIEFTPHPALAGLTSLDYLSHFPYGCVEQTMNSFVPLASYYAALKKFGIIPGDMDKIKTKIEKGLARLERYQRSDGAFGWWKDSEADLYLTSLVLLGLSRIKGIDNKKIKLLISRSAQYLKREIAETKLFDILAFSLYALSEAGYEHRVLARSLKSNLQNEDALFLSLAVLALANHNMMTDAVKAMDRLMGMIEKTEAGSFFPGPETYRNRDAVETAAYALMALLRIDPDNPEIDQIMKWLVLQKTGRYWVSTKTTGIVVAALSDYLMTHKDKIPIDDQTIALSLNKQGVTDFQIKKADFLINRVKPLYLPFSFLVQGANQLKIDCTHDIYYALRIKSFWESDSIAPASNNCEMIVSKKIFAVTRVHDSRRNPRILTRPLEEGERLQVGEEIKVQVNFTPDRDYDYFILEDGLPSGFEAVEFEKEAGMSWWYSYAHKEKRDDKVVFFFDHLNKGRGITVSYILRSELKGQFNLPPARLFGMYRPSINAHSCGIRLLVGP